MRNGPAISGNPAQTKENSPRWICRLAGRPGILLAFLWGLAEGTLFFVVPDVLLSLVAMLEPRRCWKHIAAATSGSLLAAALVYGYAQQNSRRAAEAVERMPFVNSKMFSKVEASYRAHGIGAVFLAPYSGIPYKVYAVEAPPVARELPFLAATIPARAGRFVLVCLVFGLPAAWFRRVWNWSRRSLVAIHAMVWAVFYAFYWSAIGKM